MTKDIYSGKIISKKKNNVHFLLKIDKSLEYLPGQFISIFKKENDQLLRAKPYTLASLDQRYVELYIGIVENGEFSNYLDQLQINDDIYFKGPVGIPIEKKITSNNLIIITLGCGIATYRAFIHHNVSKYNISLFFINKKKDVFFIEEFEELSKRNKNFRYTEIVGKERQDFNLEKEIRENVTYLLSGPPKATEFYSQLLKKNNVNEQNIIVN
ncbi:MAG: FAD-dependent oxidoreductase [Candidatus ainarchaeum sp.]|nr:FAD-dependent oxidoreductase [Candidatus ainarchaeum sp.]MDD3084794.1 FAD-dependent oxidoreductase [Candidatus ainarchaeum sp.]MDD4221354.1 FAD-dependent oxidoreductase [Candidatus ainarchaeum sp.]MDD4662649.1 FAD-dependent oxidoreductase [Candidatus ainarchaeum sp.]